MTCNDCICSEVCYYKSFNDVRNLEKRRIDVEKICKSFVHRGNLKNAQTVDAVEFEIINLDDRKSYMAFPNCPFRLVIEDGEYVGWYYCGEREDND